MFCCLFFISNNCILQAQNSDKLKIELPDEKKNTIMTKVTNVAKLHRMQLVNDQGTYFLVHSNPNKIYHYSNSLKYKASQRLVTNITQGTLEYVNLDNSIHRISYQQKKGLLEFYAQQLGNTSLTLSKEKIIHTLDKKQAINTLGSFVKNSDDQSKMVLINQHLKKGDGKMERQVDISVYDSNCKKLWEISNAPLIYTSVQFLADYTITPLISNDGKTVVLSYQEKVKGKALEKFTVIFTEENPAGIPLPITPPNNMKVKRDLSQQTTKINEGINTITHTAIFEHKEQILQLKEFDATTGDVLIDKTIVLDPDFCRKNAAGKKINVPTNGIVIGNAITTPYHIMSSHRTTDGGYLYTLEPYANAHYFPTITTTTDQTTQRNVFTSTTVLVYRLDKEGNIMWKKKLNKTFNGYNTTNNYVGHTSMLVGENLYVFYYDHGKENNPRQHNRIGKGRSMLVKLNKQGEIHEEKLFEDSTNDVHISPEYSYLTEDNKLHIYNRYGIIKIYFE